MQTIYSGSVHLIDTQTIDTGLALIDSTTANAFAAPVVSAAAYDFAAYRDGKHRLDIYSSAGILWAQGYISATAPSGLAYTDIIGGTNPALNDGDMEAVGTASWAANNSTLSKDAVTVQGGSKSLKIVDAGARGGAYQRPPIIVDALYKIGGYVYNPTANAGTYGAYFRCGVAEGDNDIFPQDTYGQLDSWQSIAKHRTALLGSASAYLGYFGEVTTNDITYFDSISLQNVTMPAVTGALLLSSVGGSRGYIFKHASFDPNATGLVMKVVKVRD